MDELEGFKRRLFWLAVAIGIIIGLGTANLVLIITMP